MYSFPSLEPVHCSMSSSKCCFLTCIQISQESGKLVRYTDLFKNCSQFDVIHQVKCCSIVSKAEVDSFLDFSCFFNEPTDVSNGISCSSAFSQCSLNIWMFLVYILLKLILENFQHYFCCVGDDPITIVISNQVPSHISLDLFYLIAEIDINS